MVLLYLVIILALVIFAADRHLCLKDVEKDLKLMLGDFLVARDCSEGRIKVHYQATVSAVKQLIRTHFKEV